MSNFLKRIFSSIILIILVFICIYNGSFYLTSLLIICFFISSYEWFVMSRNRSYSFFGFIYLTLSFLIFYDLSTEVQNLIFVIFICITTDIGGYVFGKILKGPKLTKISPNKTYAGMFGSYILTLIFSPFLVDHFNIYTISFNKILIISFVVSTASQIGDLILSFFKRVSKIKNTGKLIPGHGGLLDRIDGMIFAFPVFYIFYITNFLNL